MIQENKKQNYLYSVEFLRIFLLFFVILGHILIMFPATNELVLSFFDSNGLRGWFGVEFFFIIAGFFLFKRIQETSSAVNLIKKTYWRLMPPLLFVFLLCVIFTHLNIQKVPSILTLTTGLSIPKEVTRWGDWYVATYFWCSCFLIGLFLSCKKQAFLILYTVMYLLLCLKFNAPDLGWMKTYYTVIGNQFIRGIYSMGIGMTAAFIADKLTLKTTPVTQICYTFVEVFGLLSVFSYIIYPLKSHFTFLEVEIIFAILMISFHSSYGYISSTLNQISQIKYISRYTYSIFLAHILPIRLLNLSKDTPPRHDLMPLFFVFGLAITIGVFEYHIVEKRVVPWLKKIFIK